MEDGRSTYGLDARQFKQASAILQRERLAHTLSSWQKITFKFLNFAIYGLGGLGIVVIITAFINIPLIFKGVRGAFHIWYHTLVPIFVGITLLFLTGITILFFLNLPYFRQFLRENKLIRQLGFLDALRAPWKTERRKKRLHNTMDLCARILGLLIPAGLLIAFIMAVTRTGIDLTSFVMLLVFIVVLGANIVTYFMRRSKERLELVSRLCSLLEGYNEEPEQGEDRRFRISREAYEKIAEIERAQISSQRVRSILRGEDMPGTFYVLQKSCEVREVQARLDATTRLRVEDQINNLTTEPRPSGVTEDPEAGILHIHVPETSVTLSYIVDDQARRIQILSIESSSGDAKSPSEFSG